MERNGQCLDNQCPLITLYDIDRRTRPKDLFSISEFSTHVDDRTFRVDLQLPPASSGCIKRSASRFLDC